jgi:hypothetical protein
VEELIAVIATDYVEGHRNKINHCVPAMLRKDGVSREHIEGIFEQVTADDEDPRKSMGDVGRTCDRWGMELAVKGYTGLVEHFGEEHRLVVGLSRILKRCQAAAPQVRGQATPVPDFPLHRLPPVVQTFVKAAAASTAVPVEVIAAPFMAYTGGLIGNRILLRLDPTWAASPGLTLALVAPPGSAKTHALNAASLPLRKLQRAEAAAARKRQKAYNEAKAEWKNQARNKERAAAPAEPEPMRDYFTTDSTREGLGPMLGQYPGIVINHDELSAWIGGLDRYAGGKGSDKPFYLSLWSNAEVKINRKGAPTIYCPKPVASIVGGIQPDLVKTLHPKNGDRDGFVERILPIVSTWAPVSWAMRRQAGGRLEAAAEVLDLYKRLDDLPFIEDGDDDDGATEITLSPEAEEVWAAWHDENTALSRKAPALLAGFYSKLLTYVPRFALILHALHHPPTTDKYTLSCSAYPSVLTVEHMQGAIEIGEFFRAHIHRFLPLLGTNAPGPSQEPEARIEAALRREGANTEGGWVDHSNLITWMSKHMNAETVTATLDAMCAVGKVEQRLRRTRTRPGKEWRLTPA